MIHIQAFDSPDKARPKKRTAVAREAAPSKVTCKANKKEMLQGLNWGGTVSLDQAKASFKGVSHVI